jgi:4-amino-4-deoxy-L-arabinose transferase-like glycosyltransferase
MKTYTFPLLLATAYLALALGYSAIVPIYEAPDEPGHFHLIVHLHNNHSLPVQSFEYPTYAHHPPLFYVLAALISAPADIRDNAGLPQFRDHVDWNWVDGPTVAFHLCADTLFDQGHLELSGLQSGGVLAFHLARLVSVFAGLATVLLTFAIGRLLFPNRPEIGAVTALLVAFNPQMLFINSIVTNDALLIAACTGMLWQLLRTLRTPQETRQWLYLGLWSGVAMLTKASAVAAIGVVGLCWLVYAVRSDSRPAFMLYFKNGIVFGLTFLALTGWWFVRNQLLYGDPMGWQVYRQIWSENLRPEPMTWADIPFLLDLQFKSFWGLFGWLNVYPPDWFYYIVGAFLVLSAAGWVIFFRQGGWRAWSLLQRNAMFVFVAYIVLQQGFIFYQNTVHDHSMAQGRYLFPAVVPLMLIIAIGLVTLLSARPRLMLAPAATGALFVGLAIYALFGVIEPTYRNLPHLMSLAQSTDFVFADTFAMQGYRTDIRQLDDRSRIDLQLQWKALDKPDFDYTVFVHAVDGNGETLGQHDRIPGHGLGYTPTAWEIGDVVTDTWQVDVPLFQWDSSQWESELQLRVGMYHWETGERLAERDYGDYVLLDLCQRS